MTSWLKYSSAACLIALAVLTANRTCLAEEIVEPNTGVAFAETLARDGVRLACTGVDYRTAYFFKIYAVAHYGDPAAAPEDGDAEERLRHWETVKASKAFLLKFVMATSAKTLRDAVAESIAKTDYAGAHLDALLASFEDCAKGDTLKISASADGTLSVAHGDKNLGTWKDAPLVQAVWTAWMGEHSVVKNRENLVNRDAGKAK